MWPFNRRQKESSVDPMAPPLPPEVQDYYKSEQQGRRGMAWLLALGTLLVTIALAIGLFMSGRWAYQRLSNRGKKPTTTTVSTSKPAETPKPAPETPKANTQTPASNAPTQTPASPNTNSSNAAPNTSANTSTNNAATTSPTNPTGGRGQDLPNTGPGDTLAVFVIVTLVGAALYELGLTPAFKKT